MSYEKPTTRPDASELDRLRQRVGELETAVRLREKVIRGDSARLAELTEKFEDLVRQRDARISELERERDEHDALMDLQHKRTREADKLWQQANNQPDVWPDLGQLIGWLLARAEKVEAALKAIIDIGGTLPDERLTDRTGPNDAAHRGLMYCKARSTAKAALDASQAPAPGREG